MNFLQKNKEFETIFNSLKNIYTEKYKKISFSNVIFDDFSKIDWLIMDIDDVLKCMCNFFDGHRVEEEEKQEKQKQEKQVKESLKLKEEKGFQYFIDNQLTYYYFDKNNLFQKIDFEYIFKKQYVYISNYDYELVEKNFGKEALEYLLNCLKKKSKEDI